MDLLVAGALVITLVITVFAFTRGGRARPAEPKPKAPRADDGNR